MVKESTLVEDHAANVESFAFLRNGRSHLGCRINVRSRVQRLADSWREGRRRAQSVALAVVARVVDHLSINMFVRPKNS